MRGGMLECRNQLTSGDIPRHSWCYVSQISRRHPALLTDNDPFQLNLVDAKGRVHMLSFPSHYLLDEQELKGLVVPSLEDALVRGGRILLVLAVPLTENPRKDCLSTPSGKQGSSRQDLGGAARREEEENWRRVSLEFLEAVLLSALKTIDVARLRIATVSSGERIFYDELQREGVDRVEALEWKEVSAGTALDCSQRIISVIRQRQGSADPLILSLSSQTACVVDLVLEGRDCHLTLIHCSSEQEILHQVQDYCRSSSSSSTREQAQTLMRKPIPALYRLLSTPYTSSSVTHLQVLSALLPHSSLSHSLRVACFGSSLIRKSQAAPVPITATTTSSSSFCLAAKTACGGRCEEGSEEEGKQGSSNPIRETSPLIPTQLERAASTHTPPHHARGPGNASVGIRSFIATSRVDLTSTLQKPQKEAVVGRTEELCAPEPSNTRQRALMTREVSVCSSSAPRNASVEPSIHGATVHEVEVDRTNFSLPTTLEGKLALLLSIDKGEPEGPSFEKTENQSAGVMEAYSSLSEPNTGERGACSLSPVARQPRERLSAPSASPSPKVSSLFQPTSVPNTPASPGKPKNKNALSLHMKKPCDESVAPAALLHGSSAIAHRAEEAQRKTSSHTSPKRSNRSTDVEEEPTALKNSSTPVPVHASVVVKDAPLSLMQQNAVDAVGLPRRCVCHATNDLVQGGDVLLEQLRELLAATMTDNCLPPSPIHSLTVEYYHAVKQLQRCLHTIAERPYEAPNSYPHCPNDVPFNGCPPSSFITDEGAMGPYVKRVQGLHKRLEFEIERWKCFQDFLPIFLKLSSMTQTLEQWVKKMNA